MVLGLDKEALGFLSSALTFVAYIPYIVSTWRHKTKPHVFSWIIWSLVSAIAFWGQYVGGAGPGCWMTGLTVFLTLAVVIGSLSQGDRDITRGDCLIFAAGLAAIPLWYFTENPLGAVILSSAINILGAWPTVRKAYSKPYEEMAFLYAISCFRCWLAFEALEVVSWTTGFYQATNGLLNLAVVSLLLVRRFQKKKS